MFDVNGAAYHDYQSNSPGHSHATLQVYIKGGGGLSVDLVEMVVGDDIHAGL